MPFAVRKVECDACDVTVETSVKTVMRNANEPALPPGWRTTPDGKTMCSKHSRPVDGS